MSGIRIIARLRKASPALRVREWGGSNRGSGGGSNGGSGGGSNNGSGGW
jgi:hypothetical protein